MPQTLKLAVLGGDGIGPEVTAEALKVIIAAGKRFGFSVEHEAAPVGASAVGQGLPPLPDPTLKLCLASDAILFGAVGDPRYGDLPPDQLPERALLYLRKGLDLYANLRPVRPVPALLDASTLKREVIEGVDILIFRELVSGIYFGKPRGYGNDANGRYAFNTKYYHETEVRRIAKLAFEAARQRRKKVLSVDKANALEVMQLWRETVTALGKDYPDVELTHMYVDNCAMQLVSKPKEFDVIVTSNMFGDILSDIGAQLTGSLGMLPSASIGGTVGLFEPVHGSAPDIAGKGVANPLAAILSGAMLLTHTKPGRKEAASAIEKAVESVLAQGLRCKDIARPEDKGTRVIGTVEMGDAVVKAMLAA